MINFQKSDINNPHIKPDVTVNLKMKMILLIGILIIAIVLVMGLFVGFFMSDTLETQMGERALSVAESVARIPELAKAFEDDDPASIIDPIIAPIQEALALSSLSSETWKRSGMPTRKRIISVEK
ncbi:hypothetical protein [Sporosarcina sp. BP05]|uniref:hypothetical protein n=1 Tax=Sporosarcina sp. BP05 TaxID=2758726 RepID=UPI00351C6669